MTSVGYSKTAQKHKEVYLNMPLSWVRPVLINYFIQFTFIELTSTKSNRYRGHGDE